MRRKLRTGATSRAGVALCLSVALSALAVAIPAHVSGAAPLVDPDLTITAGVNQSFPATSTSPPGATVTYTLPTASDEGGGPGSAGVSCTPSSPSFFPVGQTTVTCDAVDFDNDSQTLVSTTLTITVFAPDTDLAFTSPADITVNAASSQGTMVSFATPTATDDDASVPPVSCASGSGLTSGSVFPIGTTTVSCSVTDPDDDPATVTHTFSVTVNDTDLAITAGVSPPPVQAAGPTTGAPVTFTVPSATDESDPGPVPVTCSPVSGSWFPPGATTVTCTAVDSDDTPSTVSTTLTVSVYEPATVPDPPLIGTATPGDGSATVAFAPPAYDGSNPVTSYTATCGSSDGGTSGVRTGPYGPLTVSGLSNGHTYNCAVTAKNAIGPSAPSSASNPVVPADIVTCTDTQTCDATTSNGSSPSNPSELVDVQGTPTAATGTVQVAITSAALDCSGSLLAISKPTTLTDTGFAPGVSLKATVTQFAVATSSGEVCYSSSTPFRSQSSPTIPEAGTALLLQCSTVANLAPCQVSSTQTLTAIIVQFLTPGGDPTFSVVVPTGRLLWPSTFPAGKIGTAYASHMQSRGGKAPFHWKLASGKLAPGLTLNGASGAVTGTPTTKGTFKCVVQATDAESPPKVADISVSIKIT
jgi:hypothetical protein